MRVIDMLFAGRAAPLARRGQTGALQESPRHLSEP